MLIACLLYVTAVFSFSFFFEAKYPTRLRRVPEFRINNFSRFLRLNEIFYIEKYLCGTPMLELEPGTR